MAAVKLAADLVQRIAGPLQQGVAGLIHDAGIWHRSIEVAIVERQHAVHQVAVGRHQFVVVLAQELVP